MTIKSGFFNSVNGDRKYDARWFAEYFASFIGNGVFPNPSTGLQVVEGTNMTTVVKVGKGWINGYFVVNDSDYILQHDIADGVLKRIDRVVMRLNYLTRQIEIVVKKGTFASNPVAPSLQRNTDFVELALADVLINNGVTVITQANITDTRLNNSLCGIVHGTVDQVDTTTIFNQYQSWYSQRTNQAELDLADFMQAFELTSNQWMQQEQQDFETWFATLQDILDENVAATLTAKVQALENNKANSTDLTELQQQVTTHLAEKANLVNGKVPLEELPEISGGSWEEIIEYNFSTPTNELLFENLNLDDYKKIRIYLFDMRSQNGTDLLINFNGDTGSKYFASNSTGNVSTTTYYRTEGFLQNSTSYEGGVSTIEIENFENNYKLITCVYTLPSAYDAHKAFIKIGSWKSRDLINSMSFKIMSGYNFASGKIVIEGVKR